MLYIHTMAYSLKQWKQMNCSYHSNMDEAHRYNTKCKKPDTQKNIYTLLYVYKVHNTSNMKLRFKEYMPRWQKSEEKQWCHYHKSLRNGYLWGSDIVTRWTHEELASEALAMFYLVLSTDLSGGSICVCFMIISLGTLLWFIHFSEFLLYFRTITKKWFKDD